jgi:hypothetical protein
MAWERRHSTGCYYYRSVRRDGRVIKLYCGAGALGALAAQLDAEARARRRAEAAAVRVEQARLALMDQTMAALDQTCGLLTEAALTTAGYRRPDLAWRRTDVRAIPSR